MPTRANRSADLYLARKAGETCSVCTTSSDIPERRETFPPRHQQGILLSHRRKPDRDFPDPIRRVTHGTIAGVTLATI